MKSSLQRVSLICLLLLIESCRAGSTNDVPVTNEHAAAAEAEAAFLATTGHTVTEYSIRARQHTSSQWYFQIEGTGKFARPGYHWTVSVDRETGKTKVLSGQ